jgi:hypothetical protein
MASQAKPDGRAQQARMEPAAWMAKLALRARLVLPGKPGQQVQPVLGSTPGW